MTGDETIGSATARRLTAELARLQREGRYPSLVAGVTRGGRLLWSGGRGTVDGAVPGSGTQYRIGSITKTMTAVAVLRLRDEKLLTLDDPIGDHLPEVPFGERTIGQLLAHEAGLRAELPGEWWERVAGVAWAEFVDRLRREDVLFSAGRQFHYSNLGYAVLGELVARLRGRPWWDVLREEVLDPLGMSRTTYHPGPGAAAGWAVHPWADLVLPEPAHDTGVGAPAGQLWSTVEDLGRWAGLLLGDQASGVVDARTLSEMIRPTGVDVGGGRRGFGLGLFNFGRPDGAVVGHGGSMPGFVAALFVEPAQQTGVVVLGNATTGDSTGTLAMTLLDVMREHEPWAGPVWAPLSQVDEEALSLVGPWYWGSSAMAVRLSSAGLELVVLGRSGRSGLFRRDDDGYWVGQDGYHEGERLRPVRDAEGRVTALDIGTFVFTREPYEAGGPIPGGVDPGGWRNGL
ncbi:beta-lactamase family protein [Kineosporia rhizophila]|uniref:serine hydrolase domain-containing protein n=1 Tax=Kineosporia rhizophila TaxID=84633 RepID=UPI001E328275|nr:serine hydrolase domain-containing protein [Kineosporia rhizophila]MCE0539910.1 beta-lactamase family protein [Kineosporia rhizophila]